MLRIHGLTLFAALLIAVVPAATAGSLTSVTATPSTSQAGQSATYTLTFATSSTGNGTDVGIPNNGKIIITFPAGFTLSGVNSATSNNANMDGGFASVNGVGNVVTLVRDGLGSAVLGDKNISLSFQAVTNASVLGSSYQLTVETRTAADLPIDNGTSANFSITPGPLDHFVFNTISSPQTAGSAFSITITAQDAFNNTVTSFTGAGSTANLTANTGGGTISPTNTGAFTNGVWTGNVTISQSQASVTITATSGIVSSLSDAFTVNAGAFHHFAFNTISSPQTAGTAFSVTITAQDINNNTVTTFTGAGSTADLTANTGAGSISPTNTGAFTNGVWTGNVTITKSQASVTITATSGIVNNSSNTFTVNPGALHHFAFSNIGSPQIAGTAFSVIITAQDINNNTVTTFTGVGSTADLTANTGAGTILPTNTGAFTNGVWTGNVTITKSQAGVTITATSGIVNNSSNAFSVDAGTFHHFAFNTISSPQTAGTAFSVTITAQDINNNTVTTFTGAGSTADLTASTGVGTISPTNTGAFTNGVWTGNVTITKSQASVTITATSGSVSNSSNTFTVDTGALHHFAFSNIVSPQTAGTAFSVTITAQDANNNTITSFSGAGSTADLTASTGAGTISPTNTGAFTNGVWAGNVTITKSQASVTITATSGTVSSLSNAFTVNAGAFHHLAFNTISSPQTAGTAFSVTITAQDINNNTVLTFTGAGNTANLTASTGAGTILPTNTGAFTSGVWTGNVTITKSQASVTITATSGLISNSSNAFNVDAGALHHFVFSNIGSPQTAGTAFSVTITAQDANDNTVTSFTGTASLNDDTGTLSPSITGNFVAGQWSSNNVTITKSQDDIRIHAISNGKQGQSNLFTVNPAALSNFGFSTISSPQIAGQKFLVTITARDAYSNTVPTFASTVDLSVPNDLISPAVSGAFVDGVWSDSVSLTKSQLGIAITATQGGISNASNAFDVVPGPLERFVFGTISTPQTAGVPFPVSITALDPYDNIVTAYADSVTLSDPFGTILPQKIAGFVNGAWSGEVTLTKADPATVISASASGKISSSNQFQVLHAALDRFSISAIGDQTAGVSFSISMTAQDAYSNTVQSFAGAVTLQDSTGTISPAQSQPFSGGQWTENVSITRSQLTNVTVNFGGAIGKSNTFFVNPAALHHFSIDSVGNQVAGVPFSITIRARDLYENAVTSFASTVTLNDMTGSLQPQLIDGFQSGAWNGDIIVVQPASSNQITAVRTGGSEGGSSNNFTLAQGMRIIAIDASPAKVNQGQQGNLVAMAVENTGSRPISITSAGLTFTGPGNVSRTAQYVVTRTDTVASIAPAITRILTFTVNVSQSAALETVTIDGNVSGMVNNQVIVDNDAELTDQWTVQSSAALNIISVSAAVDTVSQGQKGYHVIMRVANTGTADAYVSSMGLRFRIGTQNVTSAYGIFPPSGMVIPGGTNSNDFDIEVDVLSTTPTGSTIIDGVIFARDANTNAVISDSGAITTDAWEVIEAALIAIPAISPSQQTVTQNQSRSWSVTMTVTNNGGSDVRLDSTRLRLIIGSDVTSQYNIISPTVFVNSQTNVLAGSGAQDQLQFVITAGSSTQTTGLAAIQGSVYFTDQGTGGHIEQSSSIGQASVRIQTPANVSITSIVPSQGFVNQGQTQDWEVTVRLQNTGQSEVQIDTVAAATKIAFSLGNDFAVRFKSYSGAAGLRLTGSSTADLVYTVDTSSHQAGVNTISGEVAWVELNSGRRIVTTGQGQTVTVQTPAQLRIDQTVASSSDVFAGSQFQVNVTVRNTGQESVRNISVDLSSNGNSMFVSPQAKSTLTGGGVETFLFNVQANAAAAFQETFTARILQATGNNTNAPAAIDTSLDSTAVVNIESNLLNSSTIISSPAAALDGVVSTGQSFRLVTQVVFAPDQIDNVQAVLNLPTGYTTTSLSTRQINASEDTVHWNIIAPPFAESAPSDIIIQVEGKDANQQTIAPSPDIISMRTIQRPQLRVVSFVSEPPGARSAMVGQLFEVQAELENDGEAAVAGNASVRLAFESSAYTTTDNLVQTFTVGAPASWMIQAPAQATLASRIYCILSSSNLPNDENGMPSTVVDDSSAVIISTIADTSLTFSNYPNPFGSPSRGETTTLYYYLRTDADVQISIYSLLGELVWQRIFQATDPQGRVGAHTDVAWDATNMAGDKVLNGVYLAYLKTGDGQQATRKIAVMK